MSGSGPVDCSSGSVAGIAIPVYHHPALTFFVVAAAMARRLVNLVEQNARIRWGRIKAHLVPVKKPRFVLPTYEQPIEANGREIPRHLGKITKFRV